MPLTDELYTASLGKGARLNGRPIHVSTQRSLSGAILSGAAPFKSRDRFPEFIRAIKSVSSQGCDLRRSGSLATDLAYLAAGKIDLLLGLDQAPWDFSAGALLVAEAGGRVSLRDGKSGTDIFAGNTALKKRLGAILNFR